MTVPEKLQALREQMRAHSLDAWIVSDADFHGSEYVSPRFQSRSWLSGFTGSAGTLVVLPERACLWTDGRYFIQAAEQLEGSTIELMRMGQPDVPEMEDFLAAQVPENGCIGFDGRCVPDSAAKRLEEKTAGKGIRLVTGPDLIDVIWTNRPPMPAAPVWELDASLTGMTREEKLARLREEMEKKKADCLLLTALDDVAWLLNLRGDDVAYTPVFLSCLLLEKERAGLFADPGIFSPEIREKLCAAGVEIHPYGEAEEHLRKIPAGRRVMTDRNTISRQMRCAFGEGVHVTEETSPAALLKAVKTETERENIRKAHIKDGIAVTKFIYWLKKTVPERTVTELEAAARLEAFRAEQADYLGPSFAPIVAYGYHGAIVHYEPTADSDIPMEPRGFCLTDTGSHYLQGTTDITRTIPLGPLTDEEKRAYTLAMRGHLRLAAAVFPEGVSGADLDCLARGPLWDQELDYDHGTGHGVGYILSVHESPPTISWRGRARQTPLKEGMLVSDEPGIYMEGKFGVRHENLLLCRREGERFLRFEPMTAVPFDRDALDISMLEPRELQALNAYHARVYEKISPGLDETERAWLAEATAPL